MFNHCMHAITGMFYFCSAAAGCTYKYTKHLNHFPTCNPYTTGILKLDCEVEAPANASVTMVHRLQGKQSSKVTIIEQDILSEILTVKSQLTITEMTDDFAL